MDGFTLIVRDEKEEKVYKQILEMPKKATVDSVAIHIIPESKAECVLPAILTDSRSYHGETAVKNFLFHL